MLWSVEVSVQSFARRHYVPIHQQNMAADLSISSPSSDVQLRNRSYDDELRSLIIPHADNASKQLLVVCDHAACAL